jgi:MoxR-like ATPase
VNTIIEGLAKAGYIASRRIATALYMAAHLEKPILVEGTAGVGKTELAIASAALLELPLIRLQCYEGLDESKALYEWKYGKQLLYTQILKDHMGPTLAGAPDLESAMERLHGVGDLFFSETFLEARPLLTALRQEGGAVSIPEIGVIKAKTPPIVFLTSNNVRDLGDALKRRCLHLHIPLPDQRLEERIVAARVPGIEDRLRRSLVAFVQAVRTMDLRKLPSISETVDWARVLVLLNVESLDADLVRETLNVLLKFEQDVTAVEARIPEMLSRQAQT